MAHVMRGGFSDDSRTVTVLQACGTLPHLALFLIGSETIRKQCACVTSNLPIGGRGRECPPLPARVCDNRARSCRRSMGCLPTFFPAFPAILYHQIGSRGPICLQCLPGSPVLRDLTASRLSGLWVGGSTSTRSNTGLLQPHLKLSNSNRISRHS